ncbi:hypothetical protein CVT26_006589 [Gymnopilus dilepis]|uniref:F-box domain-containing protein n=1 Tax=Gymnopilus dilepis TaxID=231916 RepID=A0A409Y2W7_9AGAR|nr:hypothetical protein CVT26_006589 [Gymnopilus dilepis]
MDTTPQVDCTIKFRHPCRDGSTTRCEACLRMDDLEHEGYIIPGLVSTPRSVMAELMRATRTAQNENHDPIILRLPPELASRIFELCIPRFIDDLVDVRYALISVCQGWRRIALSTPRIWAQRDVQLTSYGRPDPQMLKEWLERSRGAPLKMTIDAHNFAFSPGVDTVSSPDDKAKDLIEILNSCSDRWNDVHFSCIPEVYLELLKGNDKGTPILNSLLLMQVSLPSIKFSLEHVKSARVTLVRNAAMLFDMAPNMEDCDIPLCSPQYPCEGQDKLLQPLTNRIVHQHLRKLAIGYVEGMWQVENLLLRLTVPALESLAIEGSTREEAINMPLRAIRSLLVNSACILKELGIRTYQYETAELIHLLAQDELSTLERLEVRSNRRSEEEGYPFNELLKRLVQTAANVDGTPRPFLPFLQSLTFEADMTYDLEYFPERKFPWDQFLKTIACHQPDIHGRQRMRPLQQVKLGFWCPENKRLDEVIFMDDETVRSLLDLKFGKKGGIDLFLESVDCTIKFRHPCRDGSTTRCEACLRMDDLEHEGYIIPGLVSTPRSVMAELMRATRTAQNENHDPIILRLPPELASRIFELCIPRFIDDLVDVRYALISVCQGWRRIALSTPRIWAQRGVDLTGYMYRRPGPQMLKEWLERSRGAPLKMTIGARNSAFFTGVDTVSSQNDKAKDLIEILNSCSDRWNDVYFSCIPERFLELLKGNDKGTPILNSLLLMQISLPSIKFSLEHVKSARVTLVRNAAMIFEMAPNMEDCDIPLHSPHYHFEGEDVLLQPLTHKIAHQHLRKLTIGPVEWPWQTENLLLRLTVPALQSLTIAGAWQGEGSDIPFPAIRSMLDDSPCTLQELNLQGARYGTAELMHLLAQKKLSSLERLGVSINGQSGGERVLSDELFTRLAKTGADSDERPRPFLPSLQSLTFDAEAAYSLESFPERKFPWDQLLKLLACHQPDLHGRCHMRPLREVMLRFRCPEEKRLNEVIFMDEETVQSLVDMREKSDIKFRIEDRWWQRDLLREYQLASRTAN